MGLAVDAGNAIPSLIQEYDGFDVVTIDPNRWNPPTTIGSTTIAQSAGKLQFSNNGAGTKGISNLETIRRFGKNWRISVDLELTTSTGTSGEVSTVLYKNASCYLKVGPYKGGVVDCNCYLRYNNGAGEIAVALTGNAAILGVKKTYTFAIISDTVIVYYDGSLVTSVPFEELFNYTIRIEAGTGANADTFIAKANDYEIRNDIDTLLMTIGDLARDIKGSMGSSTTTDISGNITLTNTTEQLITFTQATYGTKFKVNLFADLEGADINYCRLYKSATSAFTNQDEVANSMKSNTVLLIPSSGAAVGDIIYFGNDVLFKRLDIYMDGGVSNTDNTFVWEYWNGAAWAALSPTDGTVNNTKVFGKNGKVTWVTNISKTTINGVNTYWVRARLSVLGTSRPVASHAQVTEEGTTGFDSQAEFLSSLYVRIYRKRGDGNYATLPVDMALPLTQCILTRNMEASGIPCWSDVKIGLKLSATPIASITIPYTGFVETIQT